MLDSVLPFRKMTKHSDTVRKGALKLILLHVHSFVKLKRDSEWLVYYCYTYITYLCAQFRNNCLILTCECTWPRHSVSSRMSEKKAMLGFRVSFSLVTAG